MSDVYAFLKLNGVEGEAQDSEYQNQIEVQSVSWGASNNSSFAHGTGSGIGKGHISDIVITKYTDKASTNLFKNCTTGKVMTDGTLTLLKLQDETKIAYYKVDLTNIVVTSFQLSASGNGQLPMESVTLHFQKFKSTYKVQEDTGTAGGDSEFGWDIQKSQAA
jgi:type VI secretion system secreted protein Hcp